MKNRGRIWILLLLMAMGLAVSLTGCGEKLNKETETESETQTEPVTEKVTETEPVTEKITETEPVTETESETEEPKVLTAQEELEMETELKGTRTMYAADNINIRSQPSTENDDNIIGSYDQGQEVTVSAETRNWYKIQADGYEGYIYKTNLSETAVEPKTPEEQQALLEQQGYTSTGDSSVDLEYNVSTYAESFSLKLSADANVRTEPSESGDIVTTISNGTQVTALGETDRWYKIEYDGAVGFVNKNLVH